MLPSAVHPPHSFTLQHRAAEFPRDRHAGRQSCSSACLTYFLCLLLYPYYLQRATSFHLPPYSTASSPGPLGDFCHNTKREMGISSSLPQTPRALCEVPPPKKKTEQHKLPSPHIQSTNLLCKPRGTSVSDAALQALRPDRIL